MTDKELLSNIENLVDEVDRGNITNPYAITQIKHLFYSQFRMQRDQAAQRNARRRERETTRA